MENISYKDSGVDIDAGNKSVELIKPLVNKTFRKEVLTGIGGFSGLFNLDVNRYKNPVLVSGTDGVGTKLKIAFDTGKHDTIGIDLVAMCVNDIITSGAEPLFFLDYIACDKIDPIKISQIVSGISEGCMQSEMALIGGETAEMPDMYSKGEYDLAGFAVGVVEKSKIIDGSLVQKGDIILGIPSSGFHSNGYSLVRHILFKANDYKGNEYIDDLNSSLDKLLLTPTRIYHSAIKKIINHINVKGIAHITGGGIIENTMRIIPDNLKINLFEWEIPKLFSWIQRLGNVKNEEMFRVFNMGVGMVIIISPSDELKANEILNEKLIHVGEII